MKVWVLEARGVLLAGYYWNGSGLKFTSDVEEAVQFVREHDAARVLADNGLLSAKPAQVELPDRDEPGAQSAAGDGAVNP
jgi:hypothetical protein